MAQQHPPRPARSVANGDSKKRKEHPSNPRSEPPNKRTKFDHRAKQRDSRALATQTSSKAFKNGELDVEKFVQAREYEIRALEDGMSRSKRALTQRAFQQVPKELRRRTASHNAKRVPKRLQRRAKREMVDDNTPTVTARRRKPTRHMRLRAETAKRLRTLGAKRKTAEPDGTAGSNVKSKDDATAFQPRAPKIKKASLAQPPVVKTKFRKRQLNKTWLPTHMFHAKRARMSPPGDALWRFAIPLTPTAKCYRPTHRAANERGAVAWDTSYMATIGLAGQQRSIDTVLRAVGVDRSAGSNSRTSQGARWMKGSRVWEGFLFQRENLRLPIAPATVIWCADPKSIDTQQPQGEDRERDQRQVFLRTHPAAFIQLWEELVRVSKVIKPQVTVEDLRFEIGSIEITGCGATEALQGALWPSYSGESSVQPVDASATWKSLGGLTSQLMLPSKVVLGLETQDPRLHHPPRPSKPGENVLADSNLMELLTNWPLDHQPAAQTLFDRRARHLATSKLPSQKAINRRRSLAPPGEYPAASPQDPKIPVLLFNTTSRDKRHATWTALLPWKCVQPFWYSIMYCPLSTGGQPRFGGLDEKRQLAFETGQPWFPGDYPGTKAGWDWEIDQRKKRECDWKRRPKSKRVNWDAVKSGPGQKGEIGLGWACDWERLLSGAPQGVALDEQTQPASAEVASELVEARASSDLACSPPVVHMIADEANNFLREREGVKLETAVATIRIKLLNRGVPQTCARIYCLPRDADSGQLRKRWLELHPRNVASRRPNGRKHDLPRVPADMPAHVQRQRLAASLLEPPRVGDDKYPGCPGEEDLIGFVTAGNYNLGEGQGTGIGSILLARVQDAVLSDAVEGRLCVVRNAGDSIGRLASWEVV